VRTQTLPSTRGIRLSRVHIEIPDPLGLPCRVSRVAETPGVNLGEEQPTSRLKPWHQSSNSRDARTRALSLVLFAADLYDGIMHRVATFYRTPDEFFALTYPTYNLRELARDVVHRLAGKNDRTVRQLELTYGGGKTHTLITLLHLVSDPASLPDLPAVHEFVQHVGMTPPKTRVAALAFDKLDVEKGMEVRSPRGRGPMVEESLEHHGVPGSPGPTACVCSTRTPGRRAKAAPAENLLVELLAIPEGRPCDLILIDEVLMYAREKVGLDPAWRSRS
jgi:hypothetical protein